MPVHFEVIGSPVTQGSKRHVGNGVLVEQGGARLKSWRHDVAAAAKEHRDRHQGVQFTGACAVVTHFRLTRPASRKKDVWCAVKNRYDGDKLTRAVWDALTASGIIADDGFIAVWGGSKRYVEADEAIGVSITIWSLTTQ